MFSLPLYIRYFENQTVLGLWYSIISILTWIVTFDLGLGNGLRNNLTVALANGDEELSRKYISSTYAILGICSLLGILLGIFIIPNIDWNRMFSIDNSIVGSEYLLKSIYILFFGVMVSFVLKLISSIYHAWQKSAVNNLISFISSLIPLVYILNNKTSLIGDKLVCLSYVHVLASWIPLLTATIIAFNSSELKPCFPRCKAVSLDVARKMLSLGGRFFVVQAAFLIITNTNEPIIAGFFGAEYVVEYRIYNSLFTIIGSIMVLALSPVWSSITKAVAEKDYLWLQRVYKLLLVVFGALSLGEFLIVPVSQFLIDIWLTEASIDIRFTYAMVFAVYGTLYILNIILTTFANGLGYLKTQLICYAIGALLKIPFIYFTKDIINSWVLVVMSNTFILLVFCMFQGKWLSNFLFKNLKGEV